MKPVVLKMGGRLLQDQQALDDLLAVCALIKRQRPVILVHGGGDQVDQWLARFGFTTEKIDGQRVSPAEQMPVITGALDGAVNGLMVSRAMLAGLNPVGLNLAAGELCQFSINHQLGAVGIAKPGNSKLLDMLLAADFTPILSSIGIGSTGELLNVNADLAAAAICQLVKGQLVLLTDVPGILDGQMQLIPTLTASEAADLVAQGIIKGGMKVKLDAALETAAALQSNIVVAGWQNPDDLKNLMQDKPVGTCIVY